MEWYEALVLVALMIAAMFIGKYLNREIFHKGRNKYEE
jgi:hypothetical protein